MKRRDTVLSLVSILVVGTASTGFLVVTQQATSPIELVFFTLPTLFIAFLCAQASRYYLVISEDDMREWEIPAKPEPKQTQPPSSGDNETDKPPET